MEYSVPALMLALGFGAALLMRKVVSVVARRGRSTDLPVEKGSVSLERVGKKRRK